MRINRLTLAGFGPYKNEQVVDFTRFEDDGIFLITGKTGAGKSSILDAICYALYNAVPRYEGTQQQLRSDHCDPTDPSFVELDFSVNGVDYRVRRTPEFDRPKQRGTGTTRQAATAELFERVEDNWQGRSARPVDVGRDLDQILGLSKDQFLQVILLAQNRFQKFLKANNDERQAVLRTLFGTRRFEQIEVALVDRRKALEVQLAGSLEQLAEQARQAAALVHHPSDSSVGTPDPDAAKLEQAQPELSQPEHPEPEWFTLALTTLKQRFDSATEAAELADARMVEADLEHRRLLEVRRGQERRTLATATLASLDDTATAVAGDRDTLETALRAATVWAHVDSRRRAADDLAVATSQEARARADYASFSGGDVTAASLETTIDQLTRQSGALSEVLTDERRLPALARDAAAAATHRDRCENAVVAATALIEAYPTQITAVAEQLGVARIEAARATGAQEALSRATTALSAARLADTLQVDLQRAQDAERGASAANLKAARQLDELLDARMSGHAGELAAALIEGEPCAVCGAVVHPNPASPGAEPVTEADVAAARLAVAGAHRVLDSAQSSAATLATQLADAKARFDGESTQSLAGLIEEARTAVAEARKAAERVAVLGVEHESLTHKLDASRLSLAELTKTRDDATRTVVETETAVKSLSQRVETQRGEHASVTDRVAALQRHLDAARSLASAITATLNTTTASARAIANLAIQLVEHGFPNEEAVSEARRSPDDITALQRRIRDYDQAVATARSILAEPELAQLPTEVADLGAPEELVACTRAARDAALTERSSLAERVRSLGAVVATALAQYEGSARLRKEHAELRELASAVQGLEPNTKRMRLETYVLAAQLEEIVAAANARLRSMTGGRFTLEHDDSVQYRNTRSGLGLAILDAHTGRARATHSLSGGETFLASLALALGLAEVVTNQAGGITLDTLFIDEGFGSLDGETLETAMNTLDSLRAGGRTIGLISHVDTMKEQITAKLRITVTEQGFSHIEIESPLP